MIQPVFPFTAQEAKNAQIKNVTTINHDALFPSRLREQRKKAGVSQAGLAKELGLVKSTIGLYETGDAVPDVKTISKMADYFGVTVDYLLCRSDISKGNANDLVVEKRFGFSTETIKNLEGFVTDENFPVNVLNFLLGDMQLYFIIESVVEAKRAKMKLEGIKQIPYYTLAKNDTDKQSEIKKYLEIRDFEREYEEACFRVSYALRKMLDEGLDTLSLPSVEKEVFDFIEARKSGFYDVEGKKAAEELPMLKDKLGKAEDLLVFAKAMELIKKYADIGDETHAD